jgi:hypothetical protein
VTTPDVDDAARFLAGNARVLDRRRFERLFSGGDARPVRDAVAAFRNSDGGFGHALEPDGRTPASQPAAVAMALGTLDEADAWDEELVAGACEWLAANAPAEGGASFVEPTVEGCRALVVSSTRPGSRHTSTTSPRVRQTTEGGRSTGSLGRRSLRVSGAGRSPWMLFAPSVPTVVSERRVRPPR